MDSLVTFQVRDLSEFSVALTAFVRLVARVGPLVLLHRGVLSESLLAAWIVALVRLLAFVDSHMFNEGFPCSEGLAAVAERANVLEGFHMGG